MDLNPRWIFLSILLLVLPVLATSNPLKATVYKELERRELRRVPDTHPQEYLLARDLRTVGDTDRSMRLLRQSLDRYPYHEPTLQLYLQLILQRENSDVLRTVVEDHYERAQSSVLYRSFFREVQQDPSGTTGDLLRWIDQRQPDPYLRRLRVRRLRDSHQFEEAAELLRDARRRFPADRWLRLLHAEVLAAQSKCDRAYRITRKLLNRYPGWHQPYALTHDLLADRSSERSREIRTRYRSLTGSDTIPTSPVLSGKCRVKLEEFHKQSS